MADRERRRDACLDHTVVPFLAHMPRCYRTQAETPRKFMALARLLPVPLADHLSVRHEHRMLTRAARAPAHSELRESRVALAYRCAMRQSLDQAAPLAVAHPLV